MSLPELHNQIQQAVFLTAPQKAALTTATTAMSEAQQNQLAQFLIKSHQDLTALRTRQAEEWTTLMTTSLQKMKSTKQKALHTIEAFDQNEETTHLKDLLNQL